MTSYQRFQNSFFAAALFLNSPSPIQLSPLSVDHFMVNYMFFFSFFLIFTLCDISQKNRKSDRDFPSELNHSIYEFTKAWFSYVGKIPDNRGFYFFLTIPDFADISDIRQRSVPDFPDCELFICDRGTGALQFRDW